MDTIGFTIEQCQTGLEAFRDEIEELLDLLEHPEQLNQEEEAEVKQRFSNLRQLLKEEYDRRKTNKGRDLMTEVEAAVYYPAVHQAYADVQITANSTPDKRWYSDIYQMQGTITGALEQLARWND